MGHLQIWRCIQIAQVGGRHTLRCFLTTGCKVVVVTATAVIRLLSRRLVLSRPAQIIENTELVLRLIKRLWLLVVTEANGRTFSCGTSLLCWLLTTCHNPALKQCLWSFGGYQVVLAAIRRLAVVDTAKEVKLTLPSFFSPEGAGSSDQMTETTSSPRDSHGGPSRSSVAASTMPTPTWERPPGVQPAHSDTNMDTWDWQALSPLPEAARDEPGSRQSVRNAAATMMACADVLGDITVDVAEALVTLLRCPDADTLSYAMCCIWDLCANVNNRQVFGVLDTVKLLLQWASFLLRQCVAASDSAVSNTHGIG